LAGNRRFYPVNLESLTSWNRGVIADTNTSDTLCSDPPRGQCQFYRDCLEARYHCGPAGYPLGYGEKYCEKFSQSQDRLSSKGQIWMLDTMECLQRYLVPDATSGEVSPSSCDALKEKAFDSHSICYVRDGLCTLELHDYLVIFEIVGVQGLFGSWDSVREVLQAAQGCL